LIEYNLPDGSLDLQLEICGKTEMENRRKKKTKKNLRIHSTMKIEMWNTDAEFLPPCPRQYPAHNTAVSSVGEQTAWPLIAEFLLCVSCLLLLAMHSVERERERRCEQLRDNM
jgi:hypothetical protein